MQRQYDLIKMQDEMLEDIGVGVERLHKQVVQARSHIQSLLSYDTLVFKIKKIVLRSFDSIVYIM